MAEKNDFSNVIPQLDALFRAITGKGVGEIAYNTIETLKRLQSVKQASDETKGFVFDPYRVLGLQPTAADEVVKSAYRALVKKYHPDVNPDPVARIVFEAIDEAYKAIGKLREWS